MAKVLIVDDEATIRELLIDTLSIAGHEVRVAADGRAALGLVDEEEPDCLILDVMMPGMSGFEVLAALRARTDGYDLPVVMLTARADDASTWRGWRAGANVYLPKPFDPLDLTARVEALVVDRPAREPGDAADEELRSSLLRQLRLLALDAAPGHPALVG